MPFVTATPRGQNNGQVITEFIDSVGTSSVTYSYPKTQESLSLRNIGTKAITATVGGTSQTLQPGQKWEWTVDFTSFSIVSSSGVQAFEAIADEDGSTLPSGGGTGPQGPQGIQGPQGVKGDKGDPGSGGGGTSTASIFKDLKANFLGDSLTQGDVTNKIYHEYLLEMLGLSVCRNYGVSGSSLIDGAGSYQPAYTRALTMDHDADLIVVFIGTNDWDYVNATLGSQFTIDASGNHVINYTTSTFYGALNTLCKDLLTRYVDKMIILMTPIHRAPDSAGHTIGSRNKNATTGLYLSEFAQAIRNVGQYYSIPVCDLFANSKLNPNETPNALKYFSATDKVHPVAAGHELIAEELASYLLATFGSQYTPSTVTDASAPTQPGVITASNVSPYWMQLDWTPSTDDVGVVGYQVERIPNIGPGASKIGFIKGTSLYVDKLTPGTSYTFDVYAKDGRAKLSTSRTLVQSTLVAGGVWDNFNRVNDVFTPGVSSSGHTWTKYGATASPKSFFGIKDKQLYVHGSGNGGDTINGGGTVGTNTDFIGVTGTATFDLTVKIPVMYRGNAYGGGYSIGIVLRATDGLNYLMLFLYQGNWTLAKITAGSLGFTSAPDVAAVDAATIRVTGSGSTITAYQNGSQMFVVTDTTNQTATIFGINSWAPENRFKDFKLI